MNLLLQRDRASDICTEGKLTLPNGVQLFTLELPWVADPLHPGGHPNVSCVPPGVYELMLHDTIKHPKTFALSCPTLDVCHEPDPAFPNARVACLIHVANVPADLEGCIGIGMSSSPCAVQSSRLAMEIFGRQVPWVTGHTLDIRDPVT